ncbi:MAG: ATP synthase subunit I [Deltaproteobacteria bacterium]|nr:ATP synthase subunit I [Deltaproteobacteria bacterium]
MANERIILLAGMLLIGFAVGLVYFQGLWLTLNKSLGKNHFGGKLLVSFVLRMGLVMTVFYIFMRDDWQRLIAMTIGFLIARQVMIRRMRAPAAPAGKKNPLPP